MHANHTLRFEILIGGATGHGYATGACEYMAGLIADRRRESRDDLISALLVARDQDDRLSEDELLSMAEAILVAGRETTVSQIPNFVYVLLHNPAYLAALRENPDLVSKAVEELMRWVPLSIGGSTARYALEDVELSGLTVRAGEPVVVALNSANRDESVFTDPDEIDFTRADAPARRLRPRRAPLPRGATRADGVAGRAADAHHPPARPAPGWHGRRRPVEVRPRDQAPEHLPVTDSRRDVSVLAGVRHTDCLPGRSEARDERSTVVGITDIRTTRAAR